MQQKLNDERNALAKLDDEFKKQSMMLSLDAQEDKKRELEKKQRQFKFMYDEFTPGDERHRDGSHQEGHEGT